MVDMIVQIAPQTAGTETSAGRQTQDGSGFAELLGEAVNENQPQVTDDAPMQTVEQKSTDADKSVEDMAAELMASLMSSVLPIAQQDAVPDQTTAVTDLAVQTADEGGISTAVTGELPKSVVMASAENTVVQATEGTAFDTSSESLADTIADTLSDEGITAESGTDASQNRQMLSADSDGVNSPVVMQVGQNASPVITTAQNGAVAKATAGNETTVPVVQNQQAKVDQPQIVEQDAQKIAAEKKTTQDGLVAGAETKIEVAAEPSREFTIKAQVVNPVKSDVGMFGSTNPNMVTEISSTDDTNVGADTSGSQNAYQNAALLANDATVNQLGQTQSTQAASQIDESLHTRVIDQIVKEVKMIKLPQQTDLVVKLTPPELGSLRVQISQSASGMTAQIETSGDQVKSLLQAHLPSLNQAFSDAGLKMDSVSVTAGTSFGSLMQDTAQGSAQQQYSGQRRNYGNTQDNGSQTMINMPINAASVEMNQGYSWLA